MSEMTMEDVRRARIELESEIGAAIRKFESESGTEVSSVTLIHGRTAELPGRELIEVHVYPEIRR